MITRNPRPVLLVHIHKREVQKDLTIYNIPLIHYDKLRIIPYAYMCVRLGLCVSLPVVVVLSRNSGFLYQLLQTALNSTLVLNVENNTNQSMFCLMVLLVISLSYSKSSFVLIELIKKQDFISLSEDYGEPLGASSIPV